MTIPNFSTPSVSPSSSTGQFQSSSNHSNTQTIHFVAIHTLDANLQELRCFTPLPNGISPPRNENAESTSNLETPRETNPVMTSEDHSRMLYMSRLESLLREQETSQNRTPSQPVAPPLPTETIENNSDTHSIEYTSCDTSRTQSPAPFYREESPLDEILAPYGCKSPI